MTASEVKEIMAKPKAVELIPKYKLIWKQSTGRPFEGCLCGNGFSRLYNLCLNYSKNDNKLKTL